MVRGRIEGYPCKVSYAFWRAEGSGDHLGMGSVWSGLSVSEHRV